MSEKRDFRQEVTDKIIQMLEQGPAPSQKPWDADKAGPLQLPVQSYDRSPLSRWQCHSSHDEHSRERLRPPPLGHIQASSRERLAGTEGRERQLVEFWQFDRQPNQKKTAGSEDKEQTSEETASRGAAPLLRIYTVFNARQILAMPPYEPKVRQEWEVVETGERILKNSGARIVHDQTNRAFYRSSTDSIHLPARPAFASAADYYGTALHELGWKYDQEELRAELISVFLAAESGIPHNPEHHAAYLDSWLEVLA